MYDGNKALPAIRHNFRAVYLDPGSRAAKRQNLHFEKYISDANHFMTMVAQRLDSTPAFAAHITKAVLHAVRDRLRPIDAVQFAQGLPMLLKAEYFDQYRIGKTPVYIRHPKDFINYVRHLYGPFAVKDLKDERFVEDCIAPVFRVLERTMDYGQVEQIKRMMNDDMAYLFY